jgi:outer membrane protein TolC
MKVRTFALLLLIPAAAAAQDGPLTLEQAIAQALASNPAVRATAAAEDASAARERQARAGYLPRVDLVEAWQRGNHPVFVFSSLLGQRRFTAADFALDALNHPDALSNHRAAIVLEQPIFDGWRTRDAARTARLHSDAARLDSDMTAANLRLEVTRAFGRALTAASARRTAESALETAREDLRRSETRRDAGIETEASVLAFRVHLAEAEAERVHAVAQETVARAALNAAMGAAIDDGRTLAPLAPRDAPAPDAAQLERTAMASRPELRQAVIRHAQAVTAASSAKSAFLPQVFFQGTAEANGGSFADRETAWAAGVQLRWNLFAGGSDAARVDEAAAMVRRAAAERERLESAIRVEVRSAVAEHIAAVAREQATRRMVEQARESQRIIRDRYEAGLAPATDVLRAAELLARAESATTAALVDVHVTAAALERAAGTPGSQK